MIDLKLPDKFIRQFMFIAFNDTVVNETVLKLYDTRVTGSVIPQHYVIMSTQTNTVDDRFKCGYRWNSSILLDVVTRYPSTGNTGSRVLAEDIVNRIRSTLSGGVNLGDGLNVINTRLDFPPDISSVSKNEVIFRKFVRVELEIN